MTQNISSVLLPASRVDFFALDDATAATAEKLAADWRFARVGVQVNREGIAAAIAAYGQYASPEMIIVETNDIGEGFIEQLGQLAGVCAAGTDAIVIGPTNDVHLYRSLVGMGVKDYLVRPVTEEDLANVIAKAMIEKRGLSGARLVSVVGAKGGVGTTTLSQMIAGTVSAQLGQKTMLLDAAGSAGTLGIALGVEPATSLAEMARIAASGSEDDMKRIVQTVSDNLSVMVSGGDAMLNDTPDADSIEVMVDRILQKYPVVVMDLSRASPSVQKRMIARSAGVVVVTSALLPSLRNARTLLGEVKIARGNLKDVRLVVNMQGLAGSEEVPAKDIPAVLSCDVAASIAFAPKIFVGAETAGKPAAGTKQAANVIGDLAPLCAFMAGTEDKEEKGGAGKSGGLFSLVKKIGKK